MEWTQERLDAMAQTVELLASLRRDDEEKRLKDEEKRLKDQVRMDALADRMDALTQSLELVVSLHRDNEERLKQLMVVSTQLSNIMAAHDLMLDEHEGRLNDLEGK
jgi:flagellar biosynthesis/type III secretory pathway chaperone